MMPRAEDANQSQHSGGVVAAAFRAASEMQEHFVLCASATNTHQPGLSPEECEVMVHRPVVPVDIFVTASRATTATLPFPFKMYGSYGFGSDS